MSAANASSSSSSSSTAQSFVVDDQGQQDLLNEALNEAKNQAFQMKRCMDAGELNGVLKHAAELLRELRTGLLSPKNYYQLYIQVVDDLNDLENYFEDLHKSGGPMSIKQLYERVQSSGNVLPRLYLLVTVGSVCLRNGEMGTKELLTDLVEMAKGIQFPLRGLFLRHYLVTKVKDKLPDINRAGTASSSSSAGASAGGGSSSGGSVATVEDSIQFLLQNFAETNRLWTRMQFGTGASANACGSGSVHKALREKDRQQVGLLVSTSLVRISQLEGVTLSLYSNQVLPQILSIIVNCKDVISQQYLMECVIQVFPDEYHLQNYEVLLQTFGKCNENANVGALLVALLQRFVNFASQGGKVFGNDEGANSGGATGAGAIKEQMCQRLIECAQSIVQNKKPLVRGSASSAPVSSSGRSLSSSTFRSTSSVSNSSATLDNSGLLFRLDSHMEVYIALIHFALKCVFIDTDTNGPNSDTASSSGGGGAAQVDVSFVEKVLKSCYEFMLPERDLFLVTSVNGPSASLMESLRGLVKLVMENLGIDTMRMGIWREMVAFLPWSMRKVFVLEFVKTLIKRKELLTSVDQVEILIDVLAPLVKDDPNQSTTTVSIDSISSSGPPSSATSSMISEMELEQRSVSKIVHLTDTSNIDTLFGMYSVLRRCFGQGGVFRIRYTLVPLVFAALKLTRTIRDRELKGETFQTSPRQVLQFIHEMVTALASKLDQMALVCIDLFLECALVADGCDFEAIAYEFITQAFIVYEDQVTNSRDQVHALELMIASLCATKNLAIQNYEVLATKTTQYAAKLIKKNDQCVMVLSCAHLFWHPSHKDGKRVLECLQRSLKIADACASNPTPSCSHEELFIDILEAYIYFYEHQTTEVTLQYLNGLFTLVKEHLENMQLGHERNEAELRVRAIVHVLELKDIHLQLAK